jgi:hypothetical protein
MCQRVGKANRPVSFALDMGELMDLVIGSDGFNAYRPHPAVHCPVEKKRL